MEATGRSALDWELPRRQDARRGRTPQRLVQTRYGVAGGVVTLPATMSRGRWCLAVEDISQIREQGDHSLTGTAVADLLEFDV